jgi:hypothetical protein
MKKMLGGLLLAASSLLAAPVVGFSVGVGAPAPVGVYAATPCPGPGYSWVAGTWVYVGGRRVWHEGYWAPPVAHFYGRDHGYAHFRR